MSGLPLKVFFFSWQPQNATRSYSPTKMPSALSALSNYASNHFGHNSPNHGHSGHNSSNHGPSGHASSNHGPSGHASSNYGHSGQPLSNHGHSGHSSQAMVHQIMGHQFRPRPTIVSTIVDPQFRPSLTIVGPQFWPNPTFIRLQSQPYPTWLQADSAAAAAKPT